MAGPISDMPIKTSLSAGDLVPIISSAPTGKDANYGFDLHQLTNFLPNLGYYNIASDGVTENAAAINAVVQNIGNRTFTGFANADGSVVNIHDSKQCLIFEPGINKTNATLLIDKGIKLWAPGGHSSAVIDYTGTGNAVVVNSTFTGAHDDPSATQNTRMFRMEGIAVNAPNSTAGIVVGSDTLRYVEFLSGQVINSPGRGIDMGQAVYFTRIGNFDVINNDVGIYAGPYCDMFTLDDRCYIASNKTAGLVLEAPTFHIANVDFEGNRGPVAQLIVNSQASTEDGSRAGVIFNVRFGPERTVTDGSGNYVPSPYDIALTQSGGGTIPVISTLTIRDSHFYSRSTGPDRKTAPILINARVAQLNIMGNRSDPAAYSSGYQVVTTNAALCGSSGSIWNNTIDDISWVDPQIRGLFKGNAPKGYLRAAQADVSLVKYQTVYRSDYTTGAEWDGEISPVCTGLADSSSRTNYGKALGIVTYATTSAQQDKPIWLAGPGATIQTTVDFTGQPLGTPVYKSGNGFTLTAPGFATALIVGRTASTGTNGMMLVTLEGASAIQGSATYDPASLADGAGVTTTVTATGAAVGDFAKATFSNDLQGILLTAWVSAADTVSVRFQNETTGALDLASGTLKVRVEKAL